MTLPTQYETRSVGAKLEVRAEGGEAPIISGYAAIFGRLSQDLGGFREMISNSAFDGALSTQADVVALVEHDPSRLIGRTKSGTLSLAKNDHGLRVTIRPPDTETGRSVVESIRRGDLDQMSFGFRVDETGDAWERLADGSVVRTLLAVDLVDVSATVFPAYVDTSVAVRSYRSRFPAPGSRISPANTRTIDTRVRLARIKAN